MRTVCIILTGLLLLSDAATANYDLILQGQMQVNLNRPISIVVVDEIPPGIVAAGSPYDLYGAAANAYGQGRCTVFIRKDKLEYLYHEIQHCAGITHTPEGD